MARKLRNGPLSSFTSHRKNPAISHPSFVISYPPYIQGLLLPELKSILSSVLLGFQGKDQWRQVGRPEAMGSCGELGNHMHPIPSNTRYRYFQSWYAGWQSHHAWSWCLSFGHAAPLKYHVS